MALTVQAIKKARPGDETKRLADEKGLYLEISPTGGKWWRFEVLTERSKIKRRTMERREKEYMAARAA